MNNPIFVVTLRGEGVWHGCQLYFAIKDTTDETLDAVRNEIAKSCNVEVYDFELNYGACMLEAKTSLRDVVACIEEVFDIQN